MLSDHIIINTSFFFILYSRTSTKLLFKLDSFNGNIVQEVRLGNDRMDIRTDDAFIFSPQDNFAVVTNSHVQMTYYIDLESMTIIEGKNTKVSGLSSFGLITYYLKRVYDTVSSINVFIRT